MFWTIISKKIFFEKKLAFYLEIGYNNPVNDLYVQIKYILFHKRRHYEKI